MLASLFRFNEDVELVWIGLIYTGVSGLLIPLYIVVMTALYRKDRKESNMTFKFINIINCLELTQATCHFITSPILVFPKLQSEFRLMINVIGSLINSCWIFAVPLMSLLAICRVLLFRGHIKSSIMPLGVKIAIGILITGMLTFFVSGAVAQNFVFKCPSWGYNESVPSALVYQDIDLTIYYPSLGVSYCTYLVMAFFIFVARSKSSVAKKKYEVSILLQYTLSTGWMAGMIFCFHHPAWFDFTSNWTIANFNISWIACAYISPLTLIVMNKKIRDECRRVLGGKRIERRCFTVMVSQSSASSRA